VKSKERITPIECLSDLPSIDEIAELPRGINWKFVFGAAILSEREKVGEEWKQRLPQFSIAVHTAEPIIQCLKLITDQEIHAHQDFFEKCAQDYGQLAHNLIHQLVAKKGIIFTPEFPLLSLNAYRGKAYPPSGKMGAWNYCIHGFHCAFTHKITEQHIEVPLTFGEEFGELDPYFFSRYILSTPQYTPLPVAIFSLHGDGHRIVKVMQQLGKFEEISSNIPGRTGVIVTDREKKKVVVSEEGFRSILQQVTVRSPFARVWYSFIQFWKK